MIESFNLVTKIAAIYIEYINPSILTFSAFGYKITSFITVTTRKEYYKIHI